MVTPPIQVTRAELDELKARQARTEALLQDIHDALMVPQPGQEKSLLVRFAVITQGIEGGTKAAKGMLFLLGFLAAIGITIKFGIETKGTIP